MVDFITLTRQKGAPETTATQLLIVAPGNRAIMPRSAIVLISPNHTTLADTATGEPAGALVLITIFTLSLVIMSIARQRIGAAVSGSNGH